MIAYSSDTSTYDNYALTSPTSVFYYNWSVEEQDLIFDKIRSNDQASQWILCTKLILKPMKIKSNFKQIPYLNYRMMRCNRKGIGLRIRKDK